MNAIKIIQDKMEKISEQEKIFRELWDNDYADNNAMVNIMLEWIINEISSLPSDTQWVDTLQRYEATEYPWLDWYYIEENDNGEYVRYESLLDLLNN